MATITQFFLHPSIGSAWAAAVADWQTGYANSGVTFTALLGDDGVSAAIITRFTIGLNTSEMVRACADIASTDRVPGGYLASSPGWRTMPGLVPATTLSKTAKLEWRNSMLPLRQAIWNNWTTADTPGWSSRDETGYYAGLERDVDFAMYRARVLQVTDALVLYTSSSGFNHSFPGNAPLSDGLMCALPVVLQASDMQQIAEPLRQIANTDVDTSLNHGQYTWSLRGRTVTG